MITVGAESLGANLQEVVRSPLSWNKAIAALLAYSLIRRNAQEKTLSVHRLVQAVLKDAMDKQARRQWVESVVLAVNEVFPFVEFTTWPQCERYLSHVLVCAELVEQYQIIGQEVARLFNQAGSYLYDRGRYVEAESVMKCALAIVEEQLGPTHPDTASSLNNLAGLYDAQGSYAQAEPLLQQALSIREQALGPDHPDTAQSVWWLAVVSERQQQYEKAEQLYERALLVYKQTLGETHPDTQNLQRQYASLLKKMGRRELPE